MPFLIYMLPKSKMFLLRICSVERLHEFKTGVIPPVIFGPNRRVGSTTSYVVGIDVAKQQYIPLTDRLAPKDKLQP